MRSVSLRNLSTIAVVAAMVVVLAPSSGNAACFESGIGCTDDHAIPASVLELLSCDAPWTVRNTRERLLLPNRRGACDFLERGLSLYRDAGHAAEQLRKSQYRDDEEGRTAKRLLLSRY